MIPGVDPTGTALRHEPIFLEGRAPLIVPPEARALGLRAGQIIPAVLESDGLKLQLEQQEEALTLRAPGSWNLQLGQTVMLRALPQTSGAWALQPVVTPPPASTDTPSTAPTSELIRLAQRGGGLSQLSSLFASGDLARWLAMDPAAQTVAAQGPTVWREALLAQLRLLQRDMSSLTPATLRQAVLASGLGAEAFMAQGLPPGGTAGAPDMKTLLRRLLRSLSEVSGQAVSAIRGALDDIEAAQLETVAAQSQGQVIFSVMIPFADAGPFEFKFRKTGVSEDDAESSFVVDVHSRHSGLGPLWLSTVVKKTSHIELKMWAERSEVARLARQNGRDLQFELRTHGLTLKAFEVITGPRPDHSPELTPEPTPSTGTGVNILV